MPYNIWCGGCNNHIGMGVRYNAEKTKVGMYYTTPIYQFRMKCHLCTNHFSIKTDPANLDYVIVEGASRQERRWDPTENGQIVPDDKTVGRKLADDAMYKLEHVSTDTGKATDAAPRLNEISDIQDRVKDDYLANRILRDKFRRRKKELKSRQEKDKEILSRASLNIGLVEECPEDIKLAHLLRIQAKKEAEEQQEDQRDVVRSQDIFKSQNIDSKQPKITTSIKHASNLLETRLLRTKGFAIAQGSCPRRSSKVDETLVKIKTNQVSPEATEKTNNEDK